MRRLRVLFVVFGAVLIGPIVLLVQRSLHSVAVEAQIRQQTVAERVFDEMERSLSRLLEDEEERSVERYVQPTTTDDHPFIIERIQIDAEEMTYVGTAPPQSPREMADESQPALPRQDATAKDGALGFRIAPAPVAKVEVARRQAPGTTVRLNASRSAEKKAGASAKSKAANELNEYETLRSLNKAVEDRFLGRSRAVMGQDADEETRTGVIDTRAISRPSPEGQALRNRGFGESRMTGRAINSSRLVLYRTVALDTSLYQQGILIDVTELGEWLRDRSIGGVPYATLEFFTETPGTARRRDAATSVFRHRFASPFADLSAHLRLQPPTSRDSGLYVRMLSGALVAATLIGLLLLYRMVSVTVRFAERRNNFVAAVSHELKTPLTAIRMYGEMLRDGVVPSEDKRAEYYRHITNESERLSRLINNVLEYSKLEKGDRRVELVTGSIVPTVEDVVETMRRHAVENGFELELAVGPDLPPVRFEADALMQVLWNLVDNAIKYARDTADRRIEVAVERGSGCVQMSVRDHGPGVDQRHLGQIFEPFYRTEDELTRSSKGTGLGLALVQGLVDHMGAEVEGRNAPEGGFVVAIRFPVAAPA